MPSENQRRIRRSGLCCLAMAAAILVVHAPKVHADKADMRAIAGAGALKCSDWIVSVKDPFDAGKASALGLGFAQWAWGYASGAAIWGGPGVFDGVYNNDHNALIDAITRRCRDYPGASIAPVVKQIIEGAPKS
jgi:hypothetical protein